MFWFATALMVISWMMLVSQTEPEPQGWYILLWYSIMLLYIARKGDQLLKEQHHGARGSPTHGLERPDVEHPAE